ncbi:MAG: hypothetical protein ACR2JF_14995 [Iamia sp.]
MPSIEELDALRDRVLRALYDSTVGGSRFFEFDKWASEEDLDGPQVREAVEWLRDRGLAKTPVTGPLAQLTPEGQDRVEDSQRSVGGGSGAVLAELTIQEFRKLEVVLSDVRRFLEEHGDELERDDLQDLKAQIETIEAQQRSPRPRRGVIGAAMFVMAFVLKAAAGGLVEAGTLEAVQALSSALGF